MLVALVKPGIYVHAKRAWSKNTVSEAVQPWLLESRHHAIDLSISKQSALFFGDSLTVGLAVSEVTKSSVNFGADHETTQTLANRISNYKSVLLEGESILLIGVNDIGRLEPDITLKNLDTILSKLTKNRTLVVYGIFPVDENASKALEGFNGKITELNIGLEVLTNKYKNASYRSINKFLADSRGNLKKKYHVGDGVHLTHHGYRHWILDLRSTLVESNDPCDDIQP